MAGMHACMPGTHACSVIHTHTCYIIQTPLFPGPPGGDPVQRDARSAASARSTSAATGWSPSSSSSAARSSCSSAACPARVRRAAAPESVCRTLVPWLYPLGAPFSVDGGTRW